MHAHVHKEFFRNQDVSPSPRLFFSFSASSPAPSFPTGGGQCLGGGHISSTPGGGYWGWWQKILPSKNYHQCSGEASSPLSLLLLLLLLLLSISSPRYFSTFPGSFIGFTERERKREKKRLSNPSSLGFQGLLLAAFNEKKDKTCVLRPRSQEFVKSLVFETSGSLLARVLVNKNRIFLFWFIEKKNSFSQIFSLQSCPWLLDEIIYRQVCQLKIFFFVPYIIEEIFILLARRGSFVDPFPSKKFQKIRKNSWNLSRSFIFKTSGSLTSSRTSFG